MKLEALHNVVEKYEFSYVKTAQGDALIFDEGVIITGSDLSELENIGIFDEPHLSPEKCGHCLMIPREHSFFVSQNFEDFLECGMPALKIPSSGYLIDEKFGWKGDSILGIRPSEFQTLKQTLHFYSLLKKFADFENLAEGLIFVRLRKLVIKPSISFPDLKAVHRNIETLDALLARLKEKDFGETKEDIFRGAIVEEFASNGNGPVVSFGSMVSKIGFLQDRFETDLKIYFAEHGFERLRDTAIARKIDLGTKIDRVITGIEAISLTVPPAIYLIVKEAKAGEGLGKLSELSTNLLLLISSAVFLLLMTLAHFRHKGMNDELQRDCSQIAVDFCTQAGDEYGKKITDIFSPLTKRLKWAMWLSLIRLPLGALPLIAIYIKAG